MWVAALLASSALYGCVEPNPGYRQNGQLGADAREATPDAGAGGDTLPMPRAAHDDAAATSDSAPPEPVGCAQRQTYYRDGDGDGYGDAAATTTSCGSAPPAGYAASAGDCDDGDARVHPAQRSFFSQPATGNTYTGPFGGGFHFDFDCDGFEQLRDDHEIFCVPGLTTCSGEGWLTPVPFCGESGIYATCGWNGWGDCVPRSQRKRLQSCR